MSGICTDGFKIYKYYKILSLWSRYTEHVELALYLLIGRKESVLRTENIRKIENRSADWAIPGPLPLAVVMMMRKSGLFSEYDIRRVALDNPTRF